MSRRQAQFMNNYEMQLQPRDGGGWQFVLTISSRRYPNYWTSPAIPVEATDEEAAMTEARRMVTNLVNVLEAAS